MMGAVIAAAAKPTREQIAAATGKTVPDVIAPGLRVLFCGINPGLYSAAVGHNFARPGNRFWPVLHQSGFTERLLTAAEEQQLLQHGLGIINIVARATATADQLSVEELRAGARSMAPRIRRYRPGYLAVLGMGAYRCAFGRPQAQIGLQPATIGETKLWVLPNPSGLNANYQRPELVRLFRELREACERAG